MCWVTLGMRSFVGVLFFKILTNHVKNTLLHAHIRTRIPHISPSAGRDCSDFNYTSSVQSSSNSTIGYKSCRVSPTAGDGTISRRRRSDSSRTVCKWRRLCVGGRFQTPITREEKTQNRKLRNCRSATVLRLRDLSSEE